MSTLSYNLEERSLVVQLDKKEALDSNLFEMLRSTGFTACVPMKVNSKKKMVKYDLAGLLSFKARLSSVMTVQEFYHLLFNFYKSLMFVFDAGHQVHPSKIDWDADLVFMDEKGRVHFVIYPVAIKTVEGKGIFNFLSLLIKHVKPFSKSDDEAFKRLQGYLEPALNNQMPTEEFIFNLANEVKGFAEVNLQGFEPVMLKALINGEDIVHEEEKEEQVVESFGSVSLDMSYIDTEVSEKTTILGLDDEDSGENDKTQVLSEEVAQFDLVGYLRREGGELFTLDPREGVDTWVFGKNPPASPYNSEAEFKISNNKFVSRSHMKIEFEDSSYKFYLSDLGSSNGTSVDGTKCTSEPVELLDGSTVKVAGEEMTFTIREV